MATGRTRRRIAGSPSALALATRNRTRIATAAIGDELGALRSRLFLLAGGLNPQTSDLADFQARAREAFGGMTIILSNAAGAEIVSAKLQAVISAVARCEGEAVPAQVGDDERVFVVAAHIPDVRPSDHPQVDVGHGCPPLVGRPLA